MSSLTRVPRSARKQADDRRADFEQRVLRAVEELLADGTPYTEIAVQKIAAASGAARSTFYRYFPDKSRLLIRMAELATADLFAAAEQWWRTEHTDRQSGVVRAIGAMIASFREHRYLLLALSEVSAYDREVGAYWRERLAVFADMVRRRLEADRDRGAIGSAVDPAATAIVLTAMVERSITVVFSETDAESAIADEALAAAIGRAIWLVVYGDAPECDDAATGGHSQ
ncbi:TetR/AcrR family transcriptional regulator [Nocardia arizonensis]|uniref:TetR/AcrR family transcriptional regulator n=1 Tax=Nocardia arizonensis TaxID=1141647 RepID=UPI0006D24C6B|nr:TetR/AcrR family transcriptional regulator [Nocardia arizonensis]